MYGPSAYKGSNPVVLEGDGLYPMRNLFQKKRLVGNGENGGGEGRLPEFGDRKGVCVAQQLSR